METRINSKTVQLTGNGTEIVRLFARLALGAFFQLWLIGEGLKIIIQSQPDLFTVGQAENASDGRAGWE